LKLFKAVQIDRSLVLAPFHPAGWLVVPFDFGSGTFRFRVNQSRFFSASFCGQRNFRRWPALTLSGLI
jgi:hypothetical protein